MFQAGGGLPSFSARRVSRQRRQCGNNFQASRHPHRRMVDGRQFSTNPRTDAAENDDTAAALPHTTPHTECIGGRTTSVVVLVVVAAANACPVCASFRITARSKEANGRSRHPPPKSKPHSLTHRPPPPSSFRLSWSAARTTLPTDRPAAHGSQDRRSERWQMVVVNKHPCASRRCGEYPPPSRPAGRPSRVVVVLRWWRAASGRQQRHSRRDTIACECVSRQS